MFAHIKKLLRKFARMILSLSRKTARKNIFESFDAAAIQAVAFAQEEARRLGHNFVGTEQLLLGLLRQEDTAAVACLNFQGVTLESAREEVVKIISYGDGAAEHIPFTPRSKRVLDLAYDESQILRCSEVRTEHLLLALIIDGEGVGQRVLDNLNVDQRQLRLALMQFADEGPGPRFMISEP